MVEVTFIGTGPAVPLPGRGNTAFVVRSSDAPDSGVLVECGPTVQLGAKNADIDLNQIPYLFISHRHGDHILGFPTLLLERMIGGLTFEPATLHVFCPASVVDVLKEIALDTYPIEIIRPMKSTVWHPLPEDQFSVLEVEPDIKLTCGPVGGPPVTPTLGLRLDFAEGLSIAYSADTAQCEQVPQLAQGCDLLIHEAYFSITVSGKVPEFYHSSARGAGMSAAMAHCRMLALVHMGPLSYGLENVWAREASESFSGQVLVPSDGDIVRLNRDTIDVIQKSAG